MTVTLQVSNLNEFVNVELTRNILGNYEYTYFNFVCFGTTYIDEIEICKR